jgi:glycosyltransferase involved in cell wall biosynthesis
MNIVLINMAFKNNSGEWIPLPPRGYGGIQWYVYHIMIGYLDLGHRVWLLGAPTTKFQHKNLIIEDVAEPEEISKWLSKNVTKNNIDIIHDHTNRIFGTEEKYGCPIVSTHHFTGNPQKSDFNVFVSYTQRFVAKHTSAMVIRVPVDPREYSFSKKKEDFLLYIGRVSKWKGVYEAAYFAHKSSLKLKIAGPAWEQDYFDKILSDFPTIEYVGEVGGEERKKLLANAKAVLVFSTSVDGPWGDKWCEPGSTVVSEAAVSGTPVISSDNGCLKEIVPDVGRVIPESEIMNLDSKHCEAILESLPNPYDIRSIAIKKWGYLHIANEYIDYFHRIIGSKKSIDFMQLKSQLHDIGAVKIHNFFTDSELSEINAITSGYIKNWERLKGLDTDYWWFDKDNKHILFRIHNLEKKHAAIKKLTENNKLLALGRKIFGEDCSFTECALVYKAPYSSAAVPWHKDPVDTGPHKIFNFSIYLDYSDKDNGALEIIPKSHLTNDNNMSRDAEILVMDAKPGDVVIHDVRVFHGSEATNDPRPRRSIVIEFRANKRGD